MDTIPVVLGARLLADGTPCDDVWTEQGARSHPSREAACAVATWQKTEIALYSIGKQTWFRRPAKLSSHAVFTAVCCCNLRNSSCILHTWL